MIYNIKEYLAFVKDCQRKCNTNWIGLECYEVHYKCLCGRYWYNEAEKYMIRGKDSHDLVLKRWRKDHAKELKDKTIQDAWKVCFQ